MSPSPLFVSSAPRVGPRFFAARFSLVALVLLALSLASLTVLHVPESAEAARQRGRPRSTGAGSDGFGDRLAARTKLARTAAQRRRERNRLRMQRNRAQSQQVDRPREPDPLHLASQTALQEDLLDHLTTAMHGERPNVPQDASQRRFPDPVPISVQREAASAVRTAVASATAHCLCCSVRDARMVLLTFDTADQPFEMDVSTEADVELDPITRTARVLQNMRLVCEPCPAAVAAGMLTDTIRLQYDVSSIIPEFGVCVLDPRGVSVHAQVNDPPSALPNEYGALEAVQHAYISEDGASMFSEDLLDDFISLDSFDASEFPDFDAVEVEVGDAEESVTLTILLCPTCHRHFDRPLPSRNPRPPALAIA